MPKENNNKGQDRRGRRDDPLGRAPERTGARDGSVQDGMEGLSLAQRVSQPPRHRSSTPRGGHSGPRGRGGYPNVGGRGGYGGHSSNRPGGSSHWNQSQSEPETAYQYSATALMTRVCAADGVPATKLTPTGLGGGFGNNWYTGTANKGLWIHSETGTGLDKMAKRLKDDNPEATGFVITMSAILPGKFDAIERDHTQKIVMNNDFRDKDNKPVGLFGRDIMLPSERKPVAQGDCEACGSDKHVLSDCLIRGYKGFVSGCTICNSRSHSVDACDEFKAMSLLEKVQTLVQARANRPPVKTSTPWWRYLHEFCDGDEFVPDVAVDFPWSKTFCVERGWKGMKKIQEDFDANREGYKFERDPSLSTFRQIFNTYWRGDGLPWPKILDNLVVEKKKVETKAKAGDNDSGSDSDVGMTERVESRVTRVSPVARNRDVPRGFDEMDVGGED